MTNKIGAIRAMRLNPFEPQAYKDFESLKIGYRFGSKHGGFEICDGPSIEAATSEIVFDDQADIASTIAPFADIYWAPAFKVFQHGEIVHDQNYVHALIPRNRDASLYIRRPCILISTNNPLALLPELKEGMDERWERKMVLNRVKKAVAEVAYRVLEIEMRQVYNSEYFYTLAESITHERAKSWGDAEKELHQRFSGFLDAKFNFGGRAAKESEIGRFTDLHQLHERIFSGMKGIEISRISTTLESATELNRFLPQHSAASHQTRAIALPGM